MKGHQLFAQSIIALLILLSLAPASGFCQALPNYPPTGRLVDAGGHLLHLHIMGKGKPTVVFESGSGDFSFIWDLVQPEVSKQATTVSYDRAGHAWSKAGHGPGRAGR